MSHSGDASSCTSPSGSNTPVIQAQPEEVVGASGGSIDAALPPENQPDDKDVGATGAAPASGAMKKKDSKRRSSKSNHHKRRDAHREPVDPEAETKQEEKHHLQTKDKPRKPKKTGKKHSKKHSKKGKKSRRRKHEDNREAILAAIKQPKGLSEFLSRDLDGLLAGITGSGTGAGAAAAGGGAESESDGDYSSDYYEDEDDNTAPSTASASELASTVAAAVAAMEQDASRRASRRGARVQSTLHVGSTIDPDEYPMDFNLKLRPGNQYSFVSRLEPSFDHHFRVTVLKEHGAPQVVHVSVNPAGTTLSVLNWWPSYLTNLGITPPLGSDPPVFGRSGTLEQMSARVETTMAARYAAGAFIGVEYEGCFRLCCVSQFKVNAAASSSVMALRARLTEELEDLRQDQQSVKFSRRLGSSHATSTSTSTTSTTVSTGGTRTSNAPVDPHNRNIGVGSSGRAHSHFTTATSTVTQTQTQRQTQMQTATSGQAMTSSSGKNDLDAMDLELMLGILPSRMPASMTQSMKSARGEGGSDGIVSAMAGIPVEHSVVTVSTVSMLFTNVGVPGLEGLGSGFVRLLGGVDFFHPKAIEVTACPLEDLPVNEDSVWLDNVLQASEVMGAAAVLHGPGGKVGPAESDEEDDGDGDGDGDGEGQHTENRKDADGNCMSRESAKTLLMAQPRVAGPVLRDAAILAIRTKDEGKYRNPIQKLLFLS